MSKFKFSLLVIFVIMIVVSNNSYSSDLFSKGEILDVNLWKEFQWDERSLKNLLKYNSWEKISDKYIEKLNNYYDEININGDEYFISVKIEKNNDYSIKINPNIDKGRFYYDLGRLNRLLEFISNYYGTFEYSNNDIIYYGDGSSIFSAKRYYQWNLNNTFVTLKSTGLGKELFLIELKFTSSKYINKLKPTIYLSCTRDVYYKGIIDPIDELDDVILFVDFMNSVVKTEDLSIVSEGERFFYNDSIINFSIDKGEFVNKFVVNRYSGELIMTTTHDEDLAIRGSCKKIQDLIEIDNKF